MRAEARGMCPVPPRLGGAARSLRPPAFVRLWMTVENPVANPQGAFGRSCPSRWPGWNVRLQDVGEAR